MDTSFTAIKIGVMAGLLLVFGSRMSADEIHMLARKGDLESVKALIEKKPELVNARDTSGRTPLHWACLGVHLDMVRYLADNGADVNTADDSSLVPLHHLAVRNSAEGIKILLAKGADVNAKNYGGQTALHLAAMSDSADAADILIQNGADIESRDDYSRTPLILCARQEGGAETIRILLEAGADANARDKFRDTALNLASWRGKKEVVDVLLDMGADIPTRGRDVPYLFSQAAANGLSRLFKAVSKAAGDPAFTQASAGTLLHSAAAGGSAEIIDILLEKGLDINFKDSYGWTPLHYAARDGRIEAVERLIARGADTETRSIMGQSPLNVADEMEHKQIREILLEKGAEDKPVQFPVLEGDYMGQDPPGEIPELFAPGIVSSIWGLHSTAAFSPNGDILMWSPMIEVPGELYSRGGILMSERSDNRWAVPRFAPFPEDGEGDVPFFAPDGKRVYFMSAMSLPGQPRSQKERIWYVDRTEKGWSGSKVVDAAVNDYPHHWQISVDADHTVYFSSAVPEGLGGGDIYRSKLEDDHWQAPENLRAPVNSEESEEMPFIASDGSYLLFSRTYNLYICFRNKDGTWAEPVKLDKPINSDSIDICPIVSPDGKYLFFLSQRGGESHIWWVDAGFIERLKR